MATSISESGFQNSAEKTDQSSKDSPSLETDSLSRKETESSMDLLKIALSDYNRSRQICISNLPSTCTEDDVNLLLGGYQASEIILQKTDNQAIVVLENGGEAESIVSEINGAMVSDNKVLVSLHNSDGFLCISHLPHGFTDVGFRTLVNQYGPVCKSFLYRAEDTGESKYYGFVEYKVSDEQIKGIKNDLDWRQVEDVKVHCDNVSANLTSYQKLNSKCLFVDNLPKDYTDNAEFRDIFSRHTSPLYCQIVLKDGSSLGYGIIEYKSWQEAQQAERSLNGHKILNIPMRVTYCIPGVSAVAICTRIMSKYDKIESVSKPSLLPDPVKPSNDIINNPLVKQLTNQHPNLMGKFDQALQQLQKTYVKQLTTKTDKPGILGPAPAMPMNPLMSTNLQLGLMILLALQTQLQSPSEVYSLPVNLMHILGQPLDDEDDKSSLLGDPLSAQANIILQNLMAQVSPGKPQGVRKPEETVSSMLLSISQNYQSINLSSLIKLGQLALQINTGQSYGSSDANYHGSNRTGNSGSIPNMFDTNPRSSGGGNDNSNGLLGAAPNFMAGATQSFLQNINMLAKGRGGTSANSGSGSSLLGDPPSNFASRGVKSQGLLPDPTSTVSGRYGSSQQGNNTSRAYDDPYKSYQDYDEYYDDGSYGYGKDDEGYFGSDDYYDQQNYLYGPRDYSNYRTSGGRDSTSNYDSQGNKYQNMAAQAAAYAASNTSTYSGYGYCGYGSYSSGYGDYQSHDSGYQSRNSGYQGQDDSYTSGYNSSISSRGYDDSFSSGIGNVSRLSSSGSVSDQSSIVGYRPQSQYGTMPPPPPSQTDGHGGYDSPDISKTPHGQKRNYSQLLPPPEPSPEGGYVGQHSQGIGGHYAESYYNKRQKLDNSRQFLQY